MGDGEIEDGQQMRAGLNYHADPRRPQTPPPGPPRPVRGRQEQPVRAPQPAGAQGPGDRACVVSWAHSPHSMSTGLQSRKQGWTDRPQPGRGPWSLLRKPAVPDGTPGAGCQLTGWRCHNACRRWTRPGQHQGPTQVPPTPCRPHF